jgi:hypothetical protein
VSAETVRPARPWSSPFLLLLLLLVLIFLLLLPLFFIAFLPHYCRDWRDNDSRESTARVLLYIPIFFSQRNEYGSKMSSGAAMVVSAVFSTVVQYFFSGVFSASRPFIFR